MEAAGFGLGAWGAQGRIRRNAVEKGEKYFCIIVIASGGGAEREE